MRTGPGGELISPLLAVRKIFDSGVKSMRGERKELHEYFPSQRLLI